MMNSSSSSTGGSSHKPKIFRLDVDCNVYCYHDMIAAKRVATSRSSREGDEFYGCPLWAAHDCKFFIWKQLVEETLSALVNSKFLELKNQALEMKVKNLKMEKEILEEANKSLKLQLAVSNFPMKTVMFGFVVLVIGWIFFFGQ